MSPSVYYPPATSRVISGRVFYQPREFQISRFILSWIYEHWKVPWHFKTLNTYRLYNRQEWRHNDDGATERTVSEVYKFTCRSCTDGRSRETLSNVCEHTSPASALGQRCLNIEHQLLSALLYETNPGQNNYNNDFFFYVPLITVFSLF